MPSHEFWEGDPWLVRGYRKAHEYRNEQKNQEMWMLGRYIHEAVDVSIVNRFCKKKNEKLVQYMDKPIRITPLTEREKARQAAHAKAEFLEKWRANKAAWIAARRTAP